SATFKEQIKLQPGRNRFRIKLHDFRRVYDVYYLEGYSDMVGHPFRDGSAIMKFYRLAPYHSVFGPDELVTKAEFVRVAYDILKPSSKWFGKLGYSDVNWGDGIYRPIRTLVRNGAIEPRSSSEFGVNDHVRKIDAIISLVKLLKDVDLPEQGSDAVLSLPYLDIGSHFTNAPYIAAALKERMISSGSSLNPNALLTRVMLYEMLFNTMEIRERITAKMDR
ncbi:MAG: hypothetical protein O3A01_08725, partial [bacterium]|nr:hypothetical protein [bacterium]